MEPNQTILIAVFYGGTWYKGDNDCWQFKNYESKLTEVPKNCTYEELKDEVYDIVNVDRDRYNLKMTFHYVVSYQPCAPQEITRDKDVKIFLRVVKEVTPVTSLYVEILPKVYEFNSMEGGNNDRFRIFNSGSGSNHFSSSCPSIRTTGILRGDNSMEEAQLRESNVLQNSIWENYVCGSPIWESEAPENQIPQTEVPVHVEEPDFHPFEVPVTCSREPPQKISSVNQPTTNSTNEGDSIPSTSRISLRSASSRFMDIEAGCDTRDEFHIGQVYDDKNGLKQKLSLYAVERNFQFKVVRSSTTRYEVRCFHDTCKWMLRANKIPHSDKLFIVKAYSNDHACLQYSQATNGNHRQATSRVIGDAIKEKYEGIARVYKPKEIKFDMKLKYGVDISYDKAWRAREHALNSIRGTAEESFSKLPSYFAMLEAKNPGTVTRIATDDEQCFKYCFMALGASIRGFQSNIRPVVAVDGTTLKHRYRGYLYIAAAIDGNGQIYPLAFGVGDGENENAYTWFFQCFKEAYGEPNNLVFVSDRHKGIENALKVVYPNSYHGLCMYHISQNLKAKKFGHEDQILPAFYLAAKAYLSSGFEHYMNELRTINIHAVEYLSEIEVERWARCKFPVTRYNLLTTNIAECMNAILRDAREMPLVPLLETIRSKLQQWFHDRRIVAANMTTSLTSWTEERLKKRENNAQRTFVEPINPNEYRVIGGQLEGTVNLSTKSCTCKKFDLDQYPCVHGMAVCMYRHIEFHCMCSNYYHTNTLCAAYTDSIYPVGDTTQWEVPHEVQMIVVRPPCSRRRLAGRPRKNRILSHGEEKMKYKCGRCGSVGHNRARCTAPIAYPDIGTSGGET